jgi:hypothetical protein
VGYCRVLTPLYLEGGVTTPLLEWNLGFAFAEVVEGLEKMCVTRGYVYSRVDRDGETDFSVTLPSGILALVVKPLLSQRSPFSPLIIVHRTMLTITSLTTIALQDWDPFQRHVTLAFLRAGG